MHRALLPTALVAALLVAGCSGNPAPADATLPLGASETMAIAGIVQDETLAPVAGAAVSLRLTEFATTTDSSGRFAFTGLPVAPYLVDVMAAGYANATLNAEPDGNASLSFILARAAPAIPEPVTQHFTGYFECGFEALIIPASCDFLLAPAGQDPFEDLSQFTVGLGRDWSTAVVDLAFDPQPGLDGLRVTLRARNDGEATGTYEQYGRFHGPESFSFRIEPGQSYPDGVRPMPANATALQMDVYPHGHGWHALCSEPLPEDTVPEGSCPLGVGAAMNVQFDLYVTVFFVEPAPADYSLLA